MKVLVAETELLESQPERYRIASTVIKSLIAQRGNTDNRLRLALREGEILDLDSIASITKVCILTSDKSTQLQIAYLESILMGMQKLSRTDKEKFFFGLLIGLLEAVNVLLRDITPAELDKLVVTGAFRMKQDATSMIRVETFDALQFFMIKHSTSDLRLEIPKKDQARLSKALKTYFSSPYEEVREKLRTQAKQLFLLANQGSTLITDYLCSELFYCWVNFLAPHEKALLVDAVE